MTQDTKRVRVRDLKVGDLADLEGDRYADPLHSNPLLEFEYAEIEAITPETPTCTCVWFLGFDAVGFPPDHLVRIKEKSA